MLQAIRSKATSLIVKILFAALIVSFGVWGIGDIFRNSNSDTAVAHVGKTPVSAEQLQLAVRKDIDQLRGALGGTSLTMEQAKQIGVVDAALNRIVESDLLELEVDRLGIAVSDGAVRKSIMLNPNFRGASGNFDRSVYNQVLAANRLSENQYETLLRADMTRSELTISLTEGVVPADELVDALFKAQAERRTAEIATLPVSAAPAPGNPSDADIDAFYQAHPDAFRTPERRSFTLAMLRIDDVAATINVPDDRLKSEYQARMDEFQKPEQRQLQQMLLSDKAKADDAEGQLASGKPFAAVAKAVANADASALELGWVRREDLPGPLADAAFSAKQGAVTQPVQTSFGWHIVRVSAIKPAETQSFDQVKDQLRKDVSRDMAGDQIAKLANQIDDALAGGAQLDAVAKQFGLKSASFDGIDIQGKDANDKAAALPQPAATVVRTAFSTESGQTSALAELGDEGYFLVHTDKVTPSGTRALADAKADAVKFWQADQRRKALETLAKQMTDAVNGGQQLRDVAGARKIPIVVTQPVTRAGNGNLPPALIAALFSAQPNKAVNAQSGDTYVVAQLKDIVPADPVKDKVARDQLQHQMAQQMQSEFLGEFTGALRKRFPVEINQANLDRAF